MTALVAAPHALRLSPEEIARRFGRQAKALNEAQRLRTLARKRTQEAKRRALKRAQEAAEGRAYLAEQAAPTISGSLAQGLKGLKGLRAPNGRFIGVKGR